MERVLNLNEQSPLLNTLSKKIPVDLTFVQELPKNVPNFVKMQKYIPPIFRDRDLEKYIFSLPESGFLLGLCFETTLTTDGDNSDVEEGIGARIFDKILFKQYDKVLAENCPTYINTRIDELDPSVRQAYTEMIDTDTTFNNNTVTTYTPLFFSFTDSTDNALLLNYYRNLEIETSRSTETQLGLDVSLTDFSTKLVAFVGYLPDNYYNSYLFNTFSTPTLDIFSYDKYVKSYELTTGSTSKSVIFDLKALIFAIHIILKDTSGALRKIKTLDILVDNEEIVSTTKRLNYFDTGRQDNQIASHQGSHVFSYYFGLKKDRHHHSGAINTTYTDNFKLEVTFDTIPANYEMFVIAEYFTVIKADRMGRFDRQICY